MLHCLSAIFIALACGMQVEAQGAVQNNSAAPRQATTDGERPQGARPNVERGREFLGLGPKADQAAAARGQKTFVQICGFCHGPKATGGEGPDLLRSSVVLHDENGDAIGPVILKGRPAGGMPSFPAMSQEQIYDIAQFLHARVEEAANRFGYKLQNVVTGDAQAGKAFFNGPGRCAGCHSPTGDLQNVASRFEPADLQAQFLYPRSKETETVTVTLRSGEKLTGPLKRIDDFNLLMVDGEGVYRSWRRSEVSVEIQDPLACHRDLLARYTDAEMHNLLAYLVTLK